MLTQSPYNSGEAELEAKDHVEGAPLEPADCVGVLCDAQRLTSHAAQRTAHQHRAELLKYCASNTSIASRSTYFHFSAPSCNEFKHMSTAAE